MSYGLPGRASDAGPDAPRLQRDEVVYCCAECGFERADLGVRCQGAAPDLCTKRLCAQCEQSCAGCGLPVCSHHAQRSNDPDFNDLVCDQCRKCMALDLQEVA